MLRVVAAVIEKDGKIFAARRNSGILAGYWEFPGGKVEDGENDENALARELLEEFSIELGLAGWNKLTFVPLKTFQEGVLPAIKSIHNID